MNQKKIIIVIIAIMLAIIIISVILFGGDSENDLNNNNNITDPNNNDNKDDDLLEINNLYDYDEYLMVNNAMNIYFGYYQSNDMNKLINSTNNCYLEEENINLTNIKETYNINYLMFTNAIEGIKVINVNEYYKVYLVKNSVREDIINSVGYTEKVYFYTSVSINNLEKTFSVSKIAEEDYMANEIDKENYIYQVCSTNSNEYNRITVSTIHDRNIAMLYYSDLKNKYLYNEEISDIIISKPSDYIIDEFSVMETYEVNSLKNEVIVKDNKNYQYIFTIDSILNYTVSIKKIDEINS